MSRKGHLGQALDHIERAAEILEDVKDDRQNGRVWADAEIESALAHLLHAAQSARYLHPSAEGMQMLDAIAQASALAGVGGLAPSKSRMRDHLHEAIKPLHHVLHVHGINI